ncbi:MAG: AMP-binding protein, partial [Desulfobacterota bacterium]|nr:AMP-binding protein [Thermodesulfobacteriota bacterium]
IMKGPLIMQGYWNNPEETRGQLVDGWLHTGDIAQTDEDGYIFIVDRKKDMIIAGGFNIYPREIDEVLYQHPKVAEAVSVGVPDEYRGETVKAYIVLKEGEIATEKEIVDFCKTRLTGYKVPRLVEFRGSLPKSAVGKILRKILREEEAEKRKKP